MPDEAAPKIVTTAAHWGSYEIETRGGRITRVLPVTEDPDPSPIGQSFVDAIDHRARVRVPMVRKGWLENGPASRESRGAEPFVPVGWDEALDLVARELTRVREAPWQRGDLRRLLWLGERRALPSRAEPAAPLHEHAGRQRLP
jgi:anaerobic selenocysteine-containing dehydrogenase